MSPLAIGPSLSPTWFRPDPHPCAEVILEPTPCVAAVRMAGRAGLVFRQLQQLGQVSSGRIGRNVVDCLTQETK